MTVIEHGLVRDGQIVLAKPLNLPEGTRVIVHIAPVTPPAREGEGADLASLPFFGMWADREDMTDTAAWVRKEREQWHQRVTRPD